MCVALQFYPWYNNGIICISKKIHVSMSTPRKVNGDSKGEGVSKAKIFKGKYEAKLEFPEGWGGRLKLKNPFMGGMDINFSGTQ